MFFLLFSAAPQAGGLLQCQHPKVAQAAKPADEAKPRPVRKKTNTRQRMTNKADGAVK
jgi:hypothetical protein